MIIIQIGAQTKMSSIKFSKPTGHSTGIEKIAEDGSYIDVPVMALSEGIYTDMNGNEVHVTGETIDTIVENYNAKAHELYLSDRELSPSVTDTNIHEFYNRNAPNQLDHDDSTVLKTVGHVLGLMSSKKINDKTHLFCVLRVQGENNVKCVKSKLWRNLSVQYNPEDHDFVEISWVVKGADSNARALLSQNSELGGNPKMLCNFKNLLSIMQTKQQLLTDFDNDLIKLKKRYEAEKYLVALCRAGKLNKAKADNIKRDLHKYENPKDVVALLDSHLPVNRFKPIAFNLRDNEEFAVKLLKGENMSQKIDKNLSVDELLSSVKLSEKSENKDIQRSDIDKDHVLSKEHMERLSAMLKKMEEAGEDGDVEMGKEHLKKARKFAEDCMKGEVNLAEYEIEDGAKDSKELKKMGETIEKVQKELSAFRQEMINVKLADAQLTAEQVEKSSTKLNAFEKKMVELLSIYKEGEK